jgi:hypothetical protein
MDIKTVALQPTPRKVANPTQLLCQAQIVDEAGTEINDNPLKSLDNLFVPFHFQRDLSAARSSENVPKGTNKVGKTRVF